MAVLVDNRRYFSPFPLLYDSHNPACFAEITLTGPNGKSNNEPSKQTNPDSRRKEELIHEQN